MTDEVTYEGRSERTILGLPFMATCAEARWVMLQINKLPEQREHLVLDDVLNSPGSTAYDGDYLRALSEDNISAYRRLVAEAANLIEQLEANR